MTETMEDCILGRRGFQPSVGQSRLRLIRYERLTDIQLHRAIEALQRRRESEAKITQNKLPEDPIPSVSHAQHDPEFVPPKTAQTRRESDPCRVTHSQDPEHRQTRGG